MTGNTLLFLDFVNCAGKRMKPVGVVPLFDAEPQPESQSRRRRSGNWRESLGFGSIGSIPPLGTTKRPFSCRSISLTETEDFRRFPNGFRRTPCNIIAKENSTCDHRIGAPSGWSGAVFMSQICDKEIDLGGHGVPPPRICRCRSRSLYGSRQPAALLSSSLAGLILAGT